MKIKTSLKGAGTSTGMGVEYTYVKIRFENTTVVIEAENSKRCLEIFFTKEDVDKMRIDMLKRKLSK